MQLKGGTKAKGKVDVSTSVNIKPTDVKLSTGGKVTLKLPGFRLRIPDIRLKLWFFPFIRLGGFNIQTELSPIEINLDDMVVNTNIAASGVDVKATNELDLTADVSVGADGSLSAGPMLTED